MQPSNISERFLLLQKIRYTSVAMSRIAAYADFNTPGCSVIIPVLPHPPNILPELEATGAPASIISRELLTFKERCLVLRQQAEISMHKIARMPSLPSSERSSDLLSSRSILVLRETYLAQVEGLRASTVNRLSHCSTRKRAIFNKFKPILEKYFDDNPFPSSVDRHVLARQTSMTPRQVEVWFQNCRKRARKEGRVIKRRSFVTNSDHLALENLDRSCFSSTPRRSRNSSTSPSLIRSNGGCSKNRDDCTLPAASALHWASKTPLDIIQTPSPPHAFPTPYSPKDEIFPYQPEYSEFEWYRKCTINRSPRIGEKLVDVETLQLNFQRQLNLFEIPEVKSLKRKHSDDETSSNYAFYAVYPQLESGTSTFCSMSPVDTSTRRHKRRLVRNSRCPSPSPRLFHSLNMG